MIAIDTSFKHRLYDLCEVQQILAAYQALFPIGEITPALRAYWDWERARPWSSLTTNFHSATVDSLRALHDASLEIESRARAGFLSASDKGFELKAASQRHGVGFSIGVNPWTDNLLWRTFDPAPGAGREHLVVVVGHNWYPVGAGLDPESPMLDQGLHHTAKYHGPCPEAFFKPQRNAPTVFFLNLFPDFTAPDARKLGQIKDTNALSYPDCVKGLTEVLRVLAPKFERTSVISWGGATWDHMRPVAEPLVGKIGVKKNARSAPGRILKFLGFDYLAMSHPSMPNQVDEHLRRGFAALGLGRPMFELKRAA